MQEMKTDIEWEISRDGLHEGDEDRHRVENRWNGHHAGDEDQHRVENR
ncbi:hypothetical protein [Metabacillus endolithicus]|nr:hypothetical protein [Metabacillus endolithicus]UPG64914.1 hypothetical protein MVE64_07740 [Metabacillus endolithicus]